MTGIICAMEIEAKKIVAEMRKIEENTISGVKFMKGKIGFSEVVVAVCGVGKVFAGMCCEAMILTYHPDIIINVGVAGSLNKEFALLDTVVGDRVCQHDMDTTAVGDIAGYIQGIGVEIKSDKDTNDAIIEAGDEVGVKIRYAKIATGDQFIGSDEQRAYIRDKFQADICEMEGGAVAQVCIVNNVKFALLRTVSDSKCEDFAAFADKAAGNAASVILAYLVNMDNVVFG